MHQDNFAACRAVDPVVSMCQCDVLESQCDSKIQNDNGTQKNQDNLTFKNNLVAYAVWVALVEPLDVVSAAGERSVGVRIEVRVRGAARRHSHLHGIDVVNYGGQRIALSALQSGRLFRARHALVYVSENCAMSNVSLPPYSGDSIDCCRTTGKKAHSMLSR